MTTNPCALYMLPIGSHRRDTQSMSNRPTVLVTGGAGYIGSHCCRALDAAGYQPVTYDNLLTGHRSFAAGTLVVGGTSPTRPRWRGPLPSMTSWPSCTSPRQA
jgi:hypothetical protein